MNNPDPSSPSIDSRRRSFIADFFGVPGGYEVEARGVDGGAEPSAQRNVSKYLAKASSAIASAALGSAIAIGGLVAVSETMEAIHDYRYASEQSQADAVAGKNKHQAAERWIDIVDEADKSNGPSATLYSTESKKFRCRLNVYDVEGMALQMIPRLASVAGERFRTFIINHEASHCEFRANEEALRIHGDDKKIDGTDFSYATLSKLEKQLKTHYQSVYKLPSELTEGTMSSLSESYADGRGLILMAASDLSKAKTPDQRQAALNQFDLFSTHVAMYRALAVGDERHNTGNLILTVRQFVANRALSEDGLKELQAIDQDHSKASTYAMQWAVANMIERSHDVNVQTLKDALDEAKKARRVDPSGNRTDTVNGAAVLADKIDTSKSMRISAEIFSGDVKDMVKSFQASYHAALWLSTAPPSAANTFTPSQAADLASRISSPSFLGSKASTSRDSELRRRGPGPG